MLHSFAQDECQDFANLFLQKALCNTRGTFMSEYEYISILNYVSYMSIFSGGSFGRAPDSQQKGRGLESR